MAFIGFRLKSKDNKNSMKINKVLFLAVILLSNLIQRLNAQTEEAPKIILITIDGFRWQELFNGADKDLISNNLYVQNPNQLKDVFWNDTRIERRKKLMPFLWSSVKEMGQIHGNRSVGSKMDLTNEYWFSYPGYSEILTGKADERIQSNDKINNPNKTILELANNLTQYNGKVGAFGSWDVFPFIINEERSGIHVNAGFKIAEAVDLTNKEKFLNDLQAKIPRPWYSVRHDAFTHYYALEYMKRTHPNLIYIAYGETDDFAHDGNYEAYLKSAHTTDSFIKELWNFVESDSYYKGNTTLIITTDHGRGTLPLDTWRDHGKDTDGADEVWVIAFGKGIRPLGEIKVKEQLYTNQIAASIAELLNIELAKNKIGAKFEFITY